MLSKFDLEFARYLNMKKYSSLSSKYFYLFQPVTHVTFHKFKYDTKLNRFSSNRKLN